MIIDMTGIIQNQYSDLLSENFTSSVFDIGKLILLSVTIKLDS